MINGKDSVKEPVGRAHRRVLFIAFEPYGINDVETQPLLYIFAWIYDVIVAYYKNKKILKSRNIFYKICD